MIDPYPKPRWDLENDVVRLEQMIIVYEQEIEQPVSYTHLTLPTTPYV